MSHDDDDITAGTDTSRIDGLAAPLPIANLDTDQIMPKQFLTGIDKSGLARGVLYDLRHDETGAPRPGFVLNDPRYAGTSVLIGGANFGCGSSREHAVWGLQQFGIRAVIAPSFGEIFFSNAMNNRLMLVVLPEDVVASLLADAADPAARAVRIDVARMCVTMGGRSAAFELSERHRRMFLDGVDMIGASLQLRREIERFAQAHWEAQPWLKDVAARTTARLARSGWRIHA